MLRGWRALFVVAAVGITGCEGCQPAAETFTADTYFDHDVDLFFAGHPQSELLAIASARELSLVYFRAGAEPSGRPDGLSLCAPFHQWPVFTRYPFALTTACEAPAHAFDTVVAVFRDGSTEVIPVTSGLVGTTRSALLQREVGEGPWAQVSAGDRHTCGVKASGTLHCWGSNEYGELGDGTTIARASPTQESTASPTWLQASAGLSLTNTQQTCATRAGGELFCWGSRFLQPQPQPRREDTHDTRWLQVSTGAWHACAVRSDGALLCWGSNDQGELGTGATMAQHVATREGTLALDWRQVSAGASFTCAVKTNGALYCWGANKEGQLGDGRVLLTATRSPTREASGAADWAQVSAGGTHTCAVKTDGSLYCWGYNAAGQLGDGTWTRRLTPTREASMANDWAQVSTGTAHTCAVKTDGSLYCWGAGHLGRLGGASAANQPRPTQEGTSATDWAQVSAGGAHTCAVKTNGSLSCWGDGRHGQLGRGALPGLFDEALAGHLRVGADAVAERTAGRPAAAAALERLRGALDRVRAPGAGERHYWKPEERSTLRQVGWDNGPLGAGEPLPLEERAKHLANIFRHLLGKPTTDDVGDHTEFTIQRTTDDQAPRTLGPNPDGFVEQTGLDREFVEVLEGEGSEPLADKLPAAGASCVNAADPKAPIEPTSVVVCSCKKEPCPERTRWRFSFVDPPRGPFSFEGPTLRFEAKEEGTWRIEQLITDPQTHLGSSVRVSVSVQAPAPPMPPPGACTTGLIKHGAEEVRVAKVPGFLRDKGWVGRWGCSDGVGACGSDPDFSSSPGREYGYVLAEPGGTSYFYSDGFRGTPAGCFGGSCCPDGAFESMTHRFEWWVEAAGCTPWEGEFVARNGNRFKAYRLFFTSAASPKLPTPSQWCSPLFEPDVFYEYWLVHGHQPAALMEGRVPFTKL